MLIFYLLSAPNTRHLHTLCMKMRLLVQSHIVLIVHHSMTASQQSLHYAVTGSQNNLLEMCNTNCDNNCQTETDKEILKINISRRSFSQLVFFMRICMCYTHPEITLYYLYILLSHYIYIIQIFTFICYVHMEYQYTSVSIVFASSLCIAFLFI